jgi:hypothetical protein
MYERFDKSVRRAEKAARTFAAARNDSVTHTGHLLYGFFVTGADAEIPCLARLNDAPAMIATALAAPLPEGLVRLRTRDCTSSEAYASTIVTAIMNARDRGSKSISLTDLVRAVFGTGPNVALHLLDLLGVDRDSLNHELQRLTSQRS